MNDYTWPSVYFAYFFFAICFFVAVFFFVRSWKDGYWGKAGEDVKYQVFEETGRADGFPARSRDRFVSSAANQERQLHGPR